MASCSSTPALLSKPTCLSKLLTSQSLLASQFCSPLKACASQFCSPLKFARLSNPARLSDLLASCSTPTLLSKLLISKRVASQSLLASQRLLASEIARDRLSKPSPLKVARLAGLSKPASQSLKNLYSCLRVAPISKLACLSKPARLAKLLASACCLPIMMRMRCIYICLLGVKACFSKPASQSLKNSYSCLRAAPISIPACLSKPAQLAKLLATECCLPTI